MIYLEELIIEGKTRFVYQHPYNQNKCIKIEKKNNYSLYRSFVNSISKSYNQIDLENYLILQSKIGTYLPKYDTSLVKTNLGLGLCSEIIFDYSGKKSKNLSSFLVDKKIVNSSIKLLLNEFFSIILDRKIFLFDINLGNFIVQEKKDSYKLCFIDCKSLNSYKSLISLSKFSSCSLKKLQRRIDRFKKKFYISYSS